MFFYKQVSLIPGKEIRNSLQNIYGINWCKSIIISSKIGLSYPFFTNNLNYYYYYYLTSVLDIYSWLVVRIKREIKANIDLLIEINCYKGIRHNDHYLVEDNERERMQVHVKKEKINLYEKFNKK